jgi:hypothetical protein
MFFLYGKRNAARFIVSCSNKDDNLSYTENKIIFFRADRGVNASPIPGA